MEELILNLYGLDGCFQILGLPDGNFKLNSLTGSLDLPETIMGNSFEELFEKYIYPQKWHHLTSIEVKTLWRNIIIQQLIKKLNEIQATPKTLKSKSTLEHQLNITLLHKTAPKDNPLMNITVSVLTHHTAYEYESIIVKQEPKVVKKTLTNKFQTWNAPYHNMRVDGVNMSAVEECLSYTGRLEVIGNAVIIKDAHNNISEIFPVDKFQISATPMEFTQVWSVK